MSEMKAGMDPSSRLTMTRTRDLGELRKAAKADFWWRLRQAWGRKRDLPMMAAQRLLGRVDGVLQVKSQMVGSVYKVDWSRLAPWQIAKLRELLDLHVDLNEIARHFGGQVIDYGILSRKSITDTGVNFIVDAMQDPANNNIGSFDFHGLGTGTTADNNTQTALVTEIPANQYNGSVRPTGASGEGGGSNIYQSNGTHTQQTAAANISEHGLFSASSGGTMLDRHNFTPVPLNTTDTFVTTYRITFTANG